MIQEIPASKKPLYIVGECLRRTTHTMTAYEIVKYFDVCYKTAGRLMDNIYDVHRDIGFINVEITEGSKSLTTKSLDKVDRAITITLDRKYLI